MIQRDSEMRRENPANISVLIPVRNEAKNIGRCLEALKGWADEIIVIDSQSTDGTIEIAESYGARVVQFYYEGDWPKKRQWALDNLEFRNKWILLLDADEILPSELKMEISEVIDNPQCDGYGIRLEIVFLGRQLKHGGMNFYKTSLLKKGKGEFERRLANQDQSMSDIEIHEHVVVHGKKGYLKNAIRHENFNTLDRYIVKHNEYSNWEAQVHLGGIKTEIKPSLLGTQVQRRRWLKNTFRMLPFSSFLRFFYSYVIRLGFLDGRAGLIYCMFKGVQVFHTKAKIYEMKLVSMHNKETAPEGRR